MQIRQAAAVTSLALDLRRHLVGDLGAPVGGVGVTCRSVAVARGAGPGWGGVGGGEARDQHGNRCRGSRQICALEHVPVAEAHPECR